jgi:outer membrane protein TolC
MSEVSAEVLVHQVLARNPSLIQMIAAWEAAASRYPQATALDDPVLGVSAAPGAFGSRSVEGGYRIEVSQKYPFCGKRDLRGENALAEARAARGDVEDMRLQLAESALGAFYDYFLADRALAVNREGLRLLGEFRQEAKNLYVRGLGSQQDVLQAEVEIGQQRERQLALERMREVASARLNTLLHLPPDAPLPPPPQQLSFAAAPQDVQALRQAALARRPDLQALADRVAAEQASLALARRDFAPDFELMAAYDAFWQERPLRPQVGVRLNLPVRLARRRGAVAEAEARLAQRQAELDRLVDQANFQVQEAAAQVRESEQVVRLYETEILRAAQANVQAARSAYITGRSGFLNLIEAQRSLVNVWDRYYEAVAARGRRLATLARVSGGSLTPASGGLPGRP